MSRCLLAIVLLLAGCAATDGSDDTAASFAASTDPTGLASTTAAVSSDGVSWERPLSRPLFTSGTNYALYGGQVVREGDRWYLLYGMQPTNVYSSQIGLASWQGDLPTD